MSRVQTVNSRFCKFAAKIAIELKTNLPKVRRFLSYILWRQTFKLENVLRVGALPTKAGISSAFGTPSERSSSKRALNLERRLATATQLMKRGNFQLATEIRKEVLSDLYSDRSLSESEHQPPGLEPDWGSAMGHVAWLLALISCDGPILPDRMAKVILPVEHPSRFSPWLNLVSERLTLLTSPIPRAFFAGAANYHLFQPLEMLRTDHGFESTYRVVDDLYTAKVPDLRNPLMCVPPEYLEQAQLELFELGLPKDSWFVGLHIRKDASAKDRRNQPEESFFESIREITSRGGWVVRIGDETMPEIERNPMVIDLTRCPGARTDLHLYVQSKARFFLGTQSGPCLVPPVFGVPIIQTNCTSIGRSMLSSSLHSIHVPKHVENKDGRRLAFSEVLESPEGFGELSSAQLRDLSGLSLRPNTSEEILEAVREMFDRLEGNFSDDGSIDKVVSEIQQASQFEVGGKIAHSFVQSNTDWLR